MRKKLTVVYPVSTRTDFFRRAGTNIPMAFPVQKAETVANKIIQGIQKDKKRIYPSRLFRIMQIINRIFPFILFLYQKYEQKRLFRWKGELV